MIPNPIFQGCAGFAGEFLEAQLMPAHFSWPIYSCITCYHAVSIFIIFDYVLNTQANSIE